MTKRIALLALIACTLIAGCVQTTDAPVVTDSRSVAQKGAKSVAVQLDMNVGDLKLAGGAKDLMNADFRYNIPEWKPDVQYSVKGTEGTLVVRQPTVQSLAFRHGENHWDIKLRDLVPMDLKIKTETGGMKLNPNGLALTGLSVESETGGTALDMSSRFTSLASITMKGETGGLDVKLTGDYPRLTSVKLGCHTGAIKADLTGHWGKNADLDINTETGSVTVTVPKDVGVYITFHKETGRVSAQEGLYPGGTNVFTNAAFGKSPVTLRLNVSVETGSISLRTSDQ